MISDAGHRDHAKHFGEEPRTEIIPAPQHIKVTLDTWGPKEHLSENLYRYLQSNWGESPVSSALCWGRCCRGTVKMGQERKEVRACFEGRTLPQVLEGISLWFTVDGVSRACTHQLVRTRFASIMQHGGRDNDWRHRPWAMPETIRRASAYLADVLEGYLEHCIIDTKPIRNYLRMVGGTDLRDEIDNYLSHGKRLYAALVDSGIPWQDARRLLPIGLLTYLHMQFNYLSLQRFLANRLEHVMDWEINCVAQLMVREVRMKCPDVLGRNLKSHSDRLGKAAFAELDSWPPDGKYPTEYDPKKRTHHSRQMPYWVLSKDAMQGGPIHWIPTNGIYPKMNREDECLVPEARIPKSSD